MARNTGLNAKSDRGGLGRRISRLTAVLSVAALGFVGLAGVTAAPAQANHVNCGIGPGTLAGAALGGFAGSHIGSGSGRLAATALGVFLGSAIGSSADCRRSFVEPRHRTHRHDTHRHDTRRYTQPYYIQPAPRHHTTFIVPPDTHSVAPPTCREFTSEAVIAGEVQQIFGTACLQSDGSWKIVSQEIY